MSDMGKNRVWNFGLPKSVAVSPNQAAKQRDENVSSILRVHWQRFALISLSCKAVSRV